MQRGRNRGTEKADKERKNVEKLRERRWDAQRKEIDLPGKWIDAERGSIKRKISKRQTRKGGAGVEK